MKPINLTSYVKAQLREEKGNWRTICKEADVGYEWLAKFARDKIPNPGTQRVEKLANYFLNKEKEEAFIQKKRAEFRAGIRS